MYTINIFLMLYLLIGRNINNYEKNNSNITDYYNNKHVFSRILLPT